MNETYNKRRFNMYSNIYAPVGNYYSNHRKLNFNKLNIKPTDKVLIIGVGTGQDLQFLHKHKHIYLADISNKMLQKSDFYALKHNIKVQSRVCSIFNLGYDTNSFDIIILHFVLSVLDKPVEAISELKRVLKPNGKISIIDNKIPENKYSLMVRKTLNPLFKIFAMDILFDTLGFIYKSKFLISKRIQFGKNSFFEGYICKAQIIGNK